MSDLQDDPVTEERNEELGEVDADTLKAQLEQKEQDIQKLKGHWGQEKSEMMKELQALRQKQAELEGRVGEQRELITSSRKEPERDPYDLTDEQVEEFNNNPAGMVKYFKGVQERQMSMIVDALKARDEYFNGTLNETRGQIEARLKALDPETLAWKDTLDELRKNGVLARLDDKTLIEVAKATGKKPAMEYRGAAGGGGQRAQAPKARAFDPDNNGECQQWLMLWEGNVEQAKKTWEKREAKLIAGGK